MYWIAGITFTSALLIALSGLALNITESRLAKSKLNALAQNIVRSQEEERARLSRDLHDGLSQLLVSIKLQVESGLAKLIPRLKISDIVHTSFKRAGDQINDALNEVRRISHDLRPAMLDDLGLAAAIKHLAEEFESASTLSTKFETFGEPNSLSDGGNTVLFRIAQEALTNIHKHALKATQVEINLTSEDDFVSLQISDNGAGFDTKSVENHPKRGIGLSSMRERFAAANGQLELYSDSNRTLVISRIPNRNLSW